MRITDVSKFRGPLIEVHNQLFGPNGEEFLNRLNLLLKQQLILVTGINRYISNEQAVEAGGRTWWFKNQVVLDSAPQYDGAEAEVDFVDFDHDPTIEEVNGIYVDGWVPDLHAVSRHMELRPDVADDHPIALQWDMQPDGTAAYALWDRGDSERGVHVDRDGICWSRLYRFARVRKIGA